MDKFCTSCGAALNKGAKFCAKCGVNASSVSEEAGALADQTMTNSEIFQSKINERVKAETKIKATAYAKDIFADAVPAYLSAGELALPLELLPATGDLDGEGLFSLLKNGFAGIVSSFKRTLSDKKRLGIVIVLAVVWLVVNVFVALGIFPLPIQVLSWLTAAQGSVIGGSIGKGLVAAFFAQMISDKDMIQSLKSGIGQLTTTVKGSKKVYVPLLLAAGIALIVCNMMISSSLQNTMVCIAGFALSAKAMTRNGFLSRLIAALLPKAKDAAITAIMGGWALGFALFAVVSFLPGGFNGYIAGAAALIAGAIMMMLSIKKKETGEK